MEKLQRVLDGLVADGASGVLVHWRGPEGEWVGGSGVGERAGGQPVDPSSWFRAGSITKTFTAVVVLQLATEGLVRLDGPAADWLPSDVSVRQLLNHTSRLYSYTDDLPDVAGIVEGRFDHWDPRETLARVVGRPRVAEEWSYSNTNYIALGLLIEAVTGRPYADVVRDRILEPLGLHHTRLPGDDLELPTPGLHAYLEVDGDLVDVARVNVSQAWAAGELMSTAVDLNCFYSALLGGELLGAEALDEMLAAVPTGDGSAYGLGIARETLPDGQVLWGHTGGIFGYHTVSYHAPDLTRQVTLAHAGAHGEEPDTAPLLAALLG
ncbi:serine hydrolase domain-containing protein [Kribbella sp. NPDC051770]|uniref:serine hydrolase domain-containing protein n=1 Tax=Kribbella sp. NPDC051770 TaxID=3155413 RepID=UPI00343596F8